MTTISMTIQSSFQFTSGDTNLVPANPSVDTILYTVTTNQTQNISFTLKAGSHGNLELDANQITFSILPENYETPFEATIEATDGVDTAEKSVTITVDTANHTITIHGTPNRNVTLMPTVSITDFNGQIRGAISGMVMMEQMKPSLPMFWGSQHARVLQSSG